ncbi:MAG: HD domain-containing protein [Gemmatimonadetes bacterium]|nr:HD domain-containing protein [Gemmatimonadota bacterium]
MSEPIRFLNALGQALSAMTLYEERHPACQRALDVAYQELVDLQSRDPQPVFTFLGDEILYGNRPLRELKSWEWGPRLAGAGIQRLAFEHAVNRDEFEGFLADALTRIVGLSVSTAEARQTRSSPIRFGMVGLREERPEVVAEAPPPDMTLSLSAEADTVRWLHDEVSTRMALPLAEAEAVVASLGVAMHGEQRILLPLLQLKDFDQYTTTHALNVSVLTMALAEYVGCTAPEARAFGVAGLFHDIGKVKIPKEVLNKAGKLTPEERQIMNNHTVEGARIIIENEEDLDMAAVVAYEHHIMLDGGGYPTLKFRRDCHQASKLVHVCDVYDALRTNRPYREAWPSEKVLSYLQEKAGTEFDPEIAQSFVRMIREWEPRAVALETEEARAG